jgi:hypothetical protein
MLTVGLGASLVPVTFLRVYIYTAVTNQPDAPASREARPGASVVPRPGDDSLAEPTAPSSPFTPTRMRFAAIEVGKLFVDRWCGMEGVLAVTSLQDRGMDLLAHALREDPALGELALYQRVARARYPVRDDFTFLTLAGVVAVFAFSGSGLIVWFGMTLIVAVCMVCESVCRRFTSNELVCAVLGVGAAFVVAQATFPRLLAVFLIELWATVLCLAWLHRRVDRSGVPTRNDPHAS